MNNKQQKKKNNGNLGKVPTSMKIIKSSVPAASSYRIRAQPPVVQQLDKRRSLMCGHEQIATVSGSVAFSATRQRVNPGLAIFTRLSQAALVWEKYKFRKLQFVYIPAEAVTSTAGSFYLAVDYDPVDAAPSSLPALSTYETQDSSRVYEICKLDVNVKACFDGVQAKKIRCGPVGGDLQLYDACSLMYATISCADTSAIGQLWVYYEVELISPQTEPASPIPQAFSLWNLSSAQTITTATPTVVQFNEEIVNGLEVTPSSGAFTLPCGIFLVSGEIHCQDTSAEELTATLSCHIDGAVTSPPQDTRFKLNLLGSGGAMLPYTFYVTSSGANVLTLNLNLAGSAGTLTVRADASRISIRAL